MNTSHLPKTIIKNFLLLTLLWFSGNTHIMAQDQVNDLTEPTRVINLYLTSLINGDTQQLIVLIGGNMKQSNPQLIKNPETYSRFLKQHYNKAQTVVESIVPNVDRLQARVRFDFPNGESTLILFILTQVNNQWLITDELSDTTE